MSILFYKTFPKRKLQLEFLVKLSLKSAFEQLRLVGLLGVIIRGFRTPTVLFPAQEILRFRNQFSAVSQALLLMLNCELSDILLLIYLALKY